MRILFLGPRWYGSCARACCAALRRLGHDVTDLSPEDFGLRFSSLLGRVAMRIAEPFSRREYNRVIIATARMVRPDFVLAFKGVGVLPDTIRAMRELGIATYNYYPDRVSLIKQGINIEALSEYDCLFDTKRAWDATVSKELRCKNRVILPHGYDDELHRPVVLSENERQRFGCDVGYVGTYMPRKADILLPFVEMRPNADLRIWGAGWHRADTKLRRFVAGSAVTGTMFSRVICASNISLGVMGITRDAVDETTTRTFEIPACGSFMLHERTPEVLELFKEGKEIECFSSTEELAAKIDYYLKHADERDAIARRGHERCVPAYSYENRVQRIVSWHLSRSETKAKAARS